MAFPSFLLEYRYGDRLVPVVADPKIGSTRHFFVAETHAGVEAAFMGSPSRVRDYVQRYASKSTRNTSWLRSSEAA